jgi:hypothetical protein
MGGTQTADIFDKLHAQSQAAGSTQSPAPSRGDIFDLIHAGGGKINPAAVRGAYQTTPGGPVQNVNDTSGQATDYAGNRMIVPRQGASFFDRGESFEDTMKRAVEAGRNMTPEELSKAAQDDRKLAPVVLAAAPLIGAGGAAAITGMSEAGAAVVAPRAITSSVGTGILDAAGNEFMKDVTTYGPSLLRQYGAKIAVPLARFALRSGGDVALYKAVDWLSKML